MIRFIILFLLITTSALADSESTIGGRTGKSHIIQEEGTSLRPRAYLNFTGVSTCSDVGGKTVCDIDPKISDVLTNCNITDDFCFKYVDGICCIDPVVQTLLPGRSPA